MAAVRPVASSAMAGTHGICVWMTGPRRAGKSTIARLVVEQRQAAGHSVVLIDDAEVREYLPMGDAASRRSLRWLVELLVSHGTEVVVAFEVPAADRDAVRAAVAGFVEVFVDTPADLCIKRGADENASYEPLLAPEVRVLTHDRDPAASAAQVVSYLEDAD